MGSSQAKVMGAQEEAKGREGTTEACTGEKGSGETWVRGHRDRFALSFCPVFQPVCEPRKEPNLTIRRQQHALDLSL